MVGQSNVLDTLTPNHVHLLSVTFFQFYLEDKCDMDAQTIGVTSQEQLKIEVKLLLGANRKSHMLCRLAQQRITLSDLEWPFHTKINIIRIARYLCGS